MELPNARVLPSNAPALPEDASGLLSTPTDLAETLSSEICQNYNRGHDCSACSLPHVCLRCKQHGHPATSCESGILRVSSGNVGSSVLQSRNADLKTGNNQKYGLRPVSSLVNLPLHSAQAAIKAEHPRRQQELSWSSPKGIPMYWHVEWQTERYRRYREKCRLRGSKNEKWPDMVEEAFQIGLCYRWTIPKFTDQLLIAIRIFRRQGRKKRNLHGKQSGGNEFIADYIKKTTGVERDRKKVSSHLQVEKKLLADNKYCGSDDLKSQPKDANCSTSGMSLVANIKTENSSKKAYGSTTHDEAVGGHDDLENDDAFTYQPSQASSHPFSKRPSAPIEILASNAYPGPTIRRVLEFTMTLVDNDSRKTLRHTFTSIQSETTSAPKALADVKHWRKMYPPLAAYYDRGQIDCPIFLFDSHLSLVDLYSSKLAVAINFSMDFSQGVHFTGWRSYPRFYEQNGCPVDLTELYLNLKPWESLKSEQVEGTDDSRLGQIGFRSKWWVQVFSSLINKKMMMANNGDPKLIREEEERAIQYVQGISVIQEIWATHRVYNHPRQRMAILLWKFDTARRVEAATTSWRRLIPPLSPYEIRSPHPPFDGPPLTLDTTLQAASPYVAHHISQPSIFSGHPTGLLVTTPLSEENSPSKTSTPENRLFPSSTSTSLPPSALNSTYPLYPSQKCSFHSQDSAYPALGSFDSHGSGYTLYEHHESVEASHESYKSHDFADGSQESYGSQEVIYHSQDSLYQHGPNQLYEYPYQTVDAPVTALTSQDFTGGQIRLSYAQTEDSQSSYEAPLIAPQANMIPQHQLIQHPEHFDQHDYIDQNPDDLSGGRYEVDEQAHAQSLPQPYELNGLTIDYSAWEEMLRLNPDLERHLSMEAVDEVGHIGQQYVSPAGQEFLESTQGQVIGEVRDGEDTLDRQLEYQ
ncbi:MAG: hypothetical protein Q9175_000057 [Cornicularia normoerica]